ncbi:hypothetical protein EVAR_75689_1 [Eumeta japonica]|uniref:Uncharacterized protein n=1 Tax=Eumeta variegata TaxID=151549 RepID=A0A4C1W174_EUMVA|nr:hypothetical protein EVAR_75689_1 [Eumeta japonica]
MNSPRRKPLVAPESGQRHVKTRTPAQGIVDEKGISGDRPPSCATRCRPDERFVNMRYFSETGNYGFEFRCEIWFGRFLTHT